VASEGFLVSNPKGNNKDLVLSYETKSGEHKKLKTLRPGEAYTCDRKNLTVVEVARPPRLLLVGDTLVADPRKVNPSGLKRV
jgi:hypothetical protein